MILFHSPTQGAQERPQAGECAVIDQPVVRRIDHASGYQGGHRGAVFLGDLAQGVTCRDGVGGDGLGCRLPNSSFLGIVTLMLIRWPRLSNFPKV